MREEKVLINGLETNYKIAGEGKPFLILHGWGGSSDSWKAVQKKISQAGYKVICLDLPGFGKSKEPPVAWSVADYTEWLLGFVNFLKLEKFFLLAHSFGGRVAVKFASIYSEKLEKLILCAPAGIKIKPGFKTRIIFWMAKIGNMFFTPRPLNRFKDRARNLFYMFLRKRDYVKANETMKDTLKKVINEDLLPDLAKVNTETLLIWGEKDRMVPLKYGYIFNKNIRKSRLKILPRIGHSPHLETPEKLSQLIMQFLQS